MQPGDKDAKKEFFDEQCHDSSGEEGSKLLEELFFGCSRSLKDPDAVCVKSEQYRDDPGNDIAEERIEEPFNCRRTQRTNTAMQWDNGK